MKTAVIALTRNGSKIAVKTGLKLHAHIYLKQDYTAEY